MGYNLHSFIGDLGDTRFIMAIVEYNYQWLSGNYSEYWNGFFMYPDKEVISYSDNLLGTLPIYSIYRLVGFDYLTSFQLLFITSHILNFLICFYCLFKLIGNKYAAACGAFIFAFSIMLNGIHNHPQYAFRFCIPLFFYFLKIYADTYSIKFLFYSLLALIMQFYLGIYLGYFLVVLGGLFIGCYFVFNVPTLEKIKKILLHSLLAILVCSVCLTPLFYYYYKRSLVTGYYMDYEFYMQTIPRLSSYLKSFPGSISWSFLSNTDVNSKFEWLHILFPGGMIFISFLLSLAFIIKGEKRSLYLAIFVTIAIFISFTTYYEGHTLYGYLMKIPGIKAARIVSRVVAVLIFFPAWLISLNIDYFQKKSVNAHSLIIAVLPLFLFFDNYCFPSNFKTFGKQECRIRVEILKTKITNSSNYRNYKVFAYIPAIQKNSHQYSLDAMLCALTMNLKTVNGYSSTSHKDFGPFWKQLDSTSLFDWCRTMQINTDSLLIIK